MSPPPVLELHEVVRSFGDVTALAGVDLRVEAGEVLGLLGHNGAGKTTTVRVLAGLLPADAGKVRVDGLDPVADGVTVRRTLGVLPARPVVDGRLTARQNLRFAAEVFGLSHDGLDERIDAALAAFELQDRADERVSGFSTGMRQRLSLARVLLPDPSILLLDEPTSALDPVAARQVRDLLGRLARDEQRTVVLCTHDLPEAEQLCDRVVVLEHGRVVADGSPSALAAEHGHAGLRLDVEVAQRPAATDVVARVVGAPPTVDELGHLVVGHLARGGVPGLLRALLDAGVEVHEARRLAPSLEDVYLALHGRARQGAPPATAEEVRS